MLTPSTTATAADAEALFRANPISSIRTIESETQLLINTKSQDLRTLVGTRYRDLIDSADSIVHMKSTCESISSNLNSIHLSLTQALSLSAPSPSPPNPTRPGVYSTACRVKYLVDTSEHIWGCLDESMFHEGANRYVRAKHVHQILEGNNGMSSNSKLLVNFPLLQHQWMIVESFKGQISTRSRERLLIDGLRIEDYADALGAVVVIDEIDDPKKVLWLFLETRKAWIKQKLGNLNNGELNSDAAVKVFVEVLRIIQLSLGQVGQLFLRVLNDMPLFYKVVLSTPPASQLYGGIPNPDEEVRLWNLFRDELESVMVVLDREFVASSCCEWLKDCGDEIVSRVNGKFLVDAFVSGEELALAEKSIRETVESKEVLESCLEWLKSVFGSEIELPWSRTRELVLGNDADLWEEIFEESFVRRMKKIIDLGFQDLVSSVNVKDTIRTIQGSLPGDQNDFQAFLLRSSLGGGVWFTDSNTKKANVISSKAPAKENDIHSCLNAYFGPEVGEIRDAVDSRCQGILVDLICFLESPKAASRLNDLVPYLQSRCYESMSTILSELRTELDNLYSVLDDSSRGESVMPSIAVERALFIGRLLFALQNHSKHVPVILGSPRSWVKENVMAGFEKLPSMFRHSRGPIDSPMHDSLGRQVFGNSRRQNSLVAMALLAVTDSASPKLEELNEVTRDLCIRAYNLWISWVSDELSIILSEELRHDDALSTTTPLRGWEETTAKQVESDESQSGMKISLPSLPSLYITSFLFQACEEIHRVGGHVLDKSILQKFAQRLLEKAIGVYEHLLSTEQALEALVSEKGVLQLLLDVRFVADVLSGGDVNVDENSLKSPVSKFPFRRKLGSNQSKSVKQVNALLNRLSQRLDPIDWQTYEPYLWENERQAYLRHAVLFGFFVQLHRMFTNTAQKLSAQPVSNILRCSTVPRFKYLPISAPALSSRGSNKASTSTSSEDLFSHNSWKAYANGDLSPKIGFDEKTSFGVATPFLKSFMQVGSRFGESTMKLGSILTDGQVGIFKDRSASAMPSFGDILPVQAAGLLSSFTATRSDST